MTEIKVCGLTRAEDVDAACELGAAILGFNFVESSPRRITVSRARALVERMPRGVARAGVFAGETREAIRHAVEEVPLDLVQLHRAISPEDFEALGAPVVAAVRVEYGAPELPAPELLARCRALLWDSSAGRGRAPDWDLLEDAESLPGPPGLAVFVAGGLDPDTVGEVIRRFRPDGVDVASGVESAPGIKDRGKLARFFAAVREADGDRG